MIAITMGDPAGVGPEIAMKAAVTPAVRGAVDTVIIGSADVMRDAAVLSGIKLPVKLITKPAEHDPNAVNLIDIGNAGVFNKGEPSATSGGLSVKCIRKAVELCVSKEAAAMVTGPISKDAIHRAGYQWPGHTEMLAALTGVETVGMMFAGGTLNLILVTIHASLRDAIASITEEKVTNSINLALKACSMLGIENPRIAVAGLNPHAGEGGLFGDEEEKHIVPAIRKAAEYADVSGPYPPDVVFKKAVGGDFDMVVAMYHDQGLIPFKMLHFDDGVNVTVGLPIIRTSPDHGTAYDIAWQGIANPSSMIEAILLAERLKL